MTNVPQDTADVDKALAEAEKLAKARSLLAPPTEAEIFRFGAMFSEKGMRPDSYITPFGDFTLEEFKAGGHFESLIERRNKKKLDDTVKHLDTLDQARQVRAERDTESTANPELTLKRIEAIKASLGDFSTMEPRSPRFLHEGFLEADTLGIIVGDGGVGKGNYLVYLAANLSRGTLPGSFLGTPKKVLYITSEDSYANTVLPRLLTHGLSSGELERVVPFLADKNGTRLRFPAFTPALRAVCKELAIEVILLDKYNDFMGMNSAGQRMVNNSDTDVDEFLMPLMKMAEEDQITILGLRHTKKGSSDLNAAALGSVQWRNVPRTGVWLAKDKDGRCTIAQFKNNNDADSNAFEYTLERTESVTVPATGKVLKGYQKTTGEFNGYPKFVMGEQTEETGQAIHEDNQKSGKERVFTEKAEDKAYRYLLMTLLTQGKIPTGDIKEHVANSGVSRDPFIKASARLVMDGIMTKPGKGFRGGSWELINRDEAKRKLELLSDGFKEDSNPNWDKPAL